MDKKEYLKNRFKRDFLQYSLLQEDSLPAKEIAEKLYGVIDLNWLIGQGKQEIEFLCNKHLSFEKVKVEGKLSNELSQELGYDLKDRIIAEYQNYLDSHSIDEITTAIISKIERSVELQTWSNGIVNMQEAIKLLVEKVKNSSRSYGNLYTAPISENEILEKFNKAKENTLLERIQGNNIDDIIEYRSALMEYVRVSCENMLYAKLKEVYASIAIDATFERLQSNFNGLSQYAQELKSSIADCETNEEWDKEYNRLIKTKLDKFFNKVSASLLKERISSIDEFIYELERLTYYFKDCDYIIHRSKGFSLDFDLNAGNEDKLDTREKYIPRDAYHQYAMGDEVEQLCTTACIELDDFTHNDEIVSVDRVEDFARTAGYNNYESELNYCDEEPQVDDVEGFARTMASNPNLNEDDLILRNKREALKKKLLEGGKITLKNNSSVQGCDSTISIPKGKLAGNTLYEEIINTQSKTFFPKSDRINTSLWSKIFRKKYSNVYSSIFAPAEVKRKSHLQVQVYLHLYEEAEKVKSLAQESDKNAERRDYIPLSLKLKKGDKVDVEFNVYGETRLMSERKSIIWQGSFTKCLFDYFVPKDIDVDELSCEANLVVNGAMIGEMRFLTQIVEFPRNLNPEILSHRFNRIFISYAHQDAQQIKLLALAYKAQGVDYFYDRESLGPGDVYEEKIFDYIDSSDLFVLCWSKNAATSDYVAKEKGRALLRAYPQLSQRDATLKICPISIEPRADLPSDMKEVYNFEVI